LRLLHKTLKVESNNNLIIKSEDEEESIEKFAEKLDFDSFYNFQENGFKDKFEKLKFGEKDFLDEKKNKVAQL